MIYQIIYVDLLKGPASDVEFPAFSIIALYDFQPIYIVLDPKPENFC
jgi:hypothetical protein